jgi:molecular chaperone GrpE (heat shock protein)
LALDESTILMFANDLIKRMDLLDMLIQRYSGQDGIDNQLMTLRAAFEDILNQYGVTEFDIDAGTVVDVKVRQRIAVIESIPGDSTPKIVTSFRAGFVYTPADGREVVLRKVEVKTSSQ